MQIMDRNGTSLRPQFQTLPKISAEVNLALINLVSDQWLGAMEEVTKLTRHFCGCAFNLC